MRIILAWIAGACVIGGIIFLAVKSDQQFEAHCKAIGGHVKTVDSSGTGISSSGKPVFVTSSTTYCLSSTGGILDSEN